MLTDTKIDRLRKPDKYPKLHADRDGLYLKHSTSGRKTWVYRSRKGGKWTVIKSGNYQTLKTATARGKLVQLLERTQVAPLTREVVNEYWEQRIERKYKNQKNVNVYASRLRDAFGHKPKDQLTTRELADNLKDYAKDAPVAANRCLAFWKLIFKLLCKGQARIGIYCATAVQQMWFFNDLFQVFCGSFQPEVVQRGETQE